MAKDQSISENEPTLDDIAASLIASSKPDAEGLSEADKQALDKVVNTSVADADEAGEEDDDEADTSEEESEEEVPSEGDNDEDPDASEDTEDEQDDTETDEEPEYLDLEDDVLVEVMVDGQAKELTFGDLKKAAAGEGAIEKRLTEATELRKKTEAYSVQMLETLTGQEQLIAQTANDLKGKLFTGLIPKPDPALKASNPAKYLKHEEAYNADQARINAANKQIEDTMTKLQQQRQQRLQAFAQHSSNEVKKFIPELFSPDQKVSSAKYKELAEVAASYGYTEQEIANALDPRMFRMVADLAKSQGLKKKATEQKKGGKLMDTGSQKTKKVVRLRSGGTTAKSRAQQSAKSKQEATKRARATGKVDDVAKTLIK